MNDSGRAKFDAALAECRLHAAVLADDKAALGNEDRCSLAQAAYRFMKLQAAALTRFLVGLSELLSLWASVESYVAQHLGRDAAGTS